MTDILEQAVLLAEYGFRVFPLHGIRDDGVCTCREGAACSRAGKHPRFNRWREDATADVTQVQALFRPWFQANIGIATGEGLVVIDCDTASAEQFFLNTFKPPQTYQVRTHKGVHFYFASLHKFRTTVGWRDSIDVRAESGLVVAAGSRHVSGFMYADLAVPVAELPVELAGVLPPVHADRSGQTQIKRRQTIAEMPMAEQIVEALYLAPARMLPEGQRNAQLFRLACRMVDSIWTGLLFSSRMDELGRAALHSGLTETEIRRILESAIRRVESDYKGNS
jgi:hypothetical protein